MDAQEERRGQLYDVLKELCADNIAYFAKDDTMNGSKIHAAFQTLSLHIDIAKKRIDTIEQFAHEYDYDEKTKGNGYRSFITVVECCIKHSIKLSRNILENRNSLLFRKAVYFKEVESCSHLLSSLTVCLEHLLTLRSWSQNGSLFPEQGHTAEELLSHGGAINQYCFYGRCLGFQFCQSMRSVLKFIASCMAGFSEGYYSDRSKLSKTTSSMWTSGKFLLDPELRARRIVNLSQNSDVHFCKAFWLLTESEMMSKVPSIVGTTVRVNKVIKIPPEPLKMLHRVTTEWVEIPIPSSHIGPGPIHARLLSYTTRKGMMGDGKLCASDPPSRGLLFHCHGGGFVAQSSKSHEIYLREWAVQLNIPILSIDYSLSPEAPFPRALEEIFYAYCWALQNCSLLGTTAERVIFAGDSAGANLNLACALKCIESGVRIPDGILLLYCPTLINFVVSPARMLCLMDPLLPFSFMMGCLRAYTCPNEELEKKQRRVAQMLNTPRIKSKTHNLFTSSTAGTAIDPRNRRSTLDSKEVVIVELAEECMEKAMESAPLDDDTIGVPSDFSVSIEVTNGGFGNGIEAEISDTSDTLASADSLRSNAEEAPTPDGINGISFEDDLPGKNMSQMMSNLDDELPTDSTDQYVRYVLGATDYPTQCHSMARTSSEENIVFDIIKNGLPTVAYNMTNSVTAPLSKLMSTCSRAVGQTEQGEDRNEMEAKCASLSENEKIRRNLDTMEARSPSEEFKFDVPKNPFVSPYYATDDTLKQLPPVKIITLEMDPCLDDCVMFAKRLKAIENDVTLDILSGLPHGFLNFVSFSKDAMEGLKLCVQRMNELLE